VSLPPLKNLPPPSSAALVHSHKLTRHIVEAIEASGGAIPFSRYMDLALYTPGLGYYASGTAKFGVSGDFITAPELSPLFGQSLARVIDEVLSQVEHAHSVQEASDHAAGVPVSTDILELGAGSGRLAVNVLQQLESMGRLPARYLILELSPDLRARQQALLQEEVPHLLPRIVWMDELPQQLNGVVIANEVLDALPVHLAHWPEDGAGSGAEIEPMERYVGWQGDKFVWLDRPIESPALLEAVARLPVEAPYKSEVSLAGPALVASLADCLAMGLILIVDYGFNRGEFYHPQRHEGTLKIHYRHYSLDDPFFLPGLADITAHVDFSAVAEAGRGARLELLGYASQGRFLLDAGILDLMGAMTPGTPDYLRAAQAVQKLVQPHEMGELFKVIAFGKGIDAPSACRRIERL